MKWLLLTNLLFSPFATAQHTECKEPSHSSSIEPGTTTIYIQKASKPSFHDIDDDHSHLLRGCVLEFNIEYERKLEVGYTPDEGLCETELLAEVNIDFPCCDHTQPACEAFSADKKSKGVMIEGIDNNVQLDIHRWFTSDIISIRNYALRRMIHMNEINPTVMAFVQDLALGKALHQFEELPWLFRLWMEWFGGESNEDYKHEKILAIGVVWHHNPQFARTHNLVDPAIKYCRQGFFECSYIESM